MIIRLLGLTGSLLGFLRRGKPEQPTFSFLYDWWLKRPIWVIQRNSFVFHVQFKSKKNRNQRPWPRLHHLLYGVPSKHLGRLQYEPNSAAIVVTRIKPWQHITPWGGDVLMCDVRGWYTKSSSSPMDGPQVSVWPSPPHSIKEPMVLKKCSAHYPLHRPENLQRKDIKCSGPDHWTLSVQGSALPHI